MGAAFNELPLALFTTLVSVGAGAFIVLAVAFFTVEFSDERLGKVDRLTVVPAVMVVVGVMAAFFHLANPAATLGVFGGLGRSPMSNELCVLVAFIAVMAVYVALGIAGKLGGARKVLAVVLAVLAVALGAFMGFAYSVETIPTWSTPWPVVQVLGYTLLGGAALGACVLALAGALGDAVKGPFKVGLAVLAIAGLALALAGLGLMASGVAGHANAIVTGSALLSDATAPLACAIACLALSCGCVLAAAYGKAQTAMGVAASLLALAGVLAGRLVFYALQISVGIYF